MSTLHRCLCYNQTSLMQLPKRQSVHIKEVSVLQSNLLNTATKRIECPHYTGVCVTVRRGPVGTALRSLRTERSIRNI